MGKQCHEQRLLPCCWNSLEMGLAGVAATQLWHHTFIDGSLADLPSRARTANHALLSGTVAARI